MEAQVQWKHGLSFEGSGETGFTVPLGANCEVGGDEDGFRPMELMLIALAGCTGMDVISILKKKQQQVTDFKVNVQAFRSQAHPRVFEKIVLEYRVTGQNIDAAAVNRAVELSATKYCPAQAMLGQAVPIESKIIILEAVG